MAIMLMVGLCYSYSQNSTIITAGWKPGVYIVKATIGNTVLSEKVIVK